MTEPLLSARGISMTFPGVKALDGVDFDVYPGDVHALIGENGAGKSTLVRILAGEIGDYDGEVRVGGEVRRFRGPREAIAAGIAEIPQELQLVSSLSAAENVFLGREPRNSVGLLDHQEMSRRCREELEAIGEGRIPPQRRIERLGSAQQPDEERDYRNRQHGGNKEGSDAIGKPLNGSTAALRDAHHLHNLRQHGLAAHALRADQ